MSTASSSSQAVVRQRSKRPAHPSDDDAESTKSKAAKQGEGHTTAAGRRAPLVDVTNQQARQAAQGKAGAVQLQAVTEESKEEPARKTRSKQVDAAVAPKAPSAAKKTTRSRAAAAASRIPVEEDADMEDAEALEEEEDEAIDEDEAALPAAAAAASSSKVRRSNVASAPASSSAAVIPFAEQASWQQGLDDPSQEYGDSIYQHLRNTELLHFPNPLYMEHVQGDLTHAMRSILVDWLVEVSQEYKLTAQTMFLAVSYIDRFLSQVQIDRAKLQLVGITSMLLAAKYWEIWPPAIDDFVYISDRTYSKEEVLAMENSILSCLKFKLTTPTSWEFSRRFCRAANADKKTEHLVDFLLELMLQESPSLNYRPSVIAASAVFLALYTLRLTPWSDRLEQNTGIRVEELQSCVRVMHTVYVKTCCNQNTLKAVREKFSTTEMLNVAAIKPRNINTE